MEIVTVTLIVLAAVVLSVIIERLLPVSIPTPLIQTALGVLVGALSPYAIIIEPHIFFFVFIPPLLFVDGWRIPNDELLKDSPTILSLAIGLVVVTVLGAGLFINWLVPAIPLGVAFALAAIISPTDPVAVSAIAARTPVPKRIMHILEGESLLNDASGLVAMKFAVAAVLTGTFSLLDATGTFLWLATGGIAVGVGSTLLVALAKGRLSDKIGDNSGVQILSSLLIPFFAYIVAEHIAASGILAAVASGLSMSVAERSDKALAITRIHRKATWEAIYFAASGATFILLGEQLPGLVEGAADHVEDIGNVDSSWIFAYVVAISLFLIVTRFLWVRLSLLVTFREKRSKGGKAQPRVPQQLSRITAVITLAGARGTVTLAGIMTLPLFLPNGDEFPARDLAVLLAAGVILVSLVVASVGLPLALKGLRKDRADHEQAEIDNALVRSAQAAISAVEKQLLANGHGAADKAHLARQGNFVLDYYRDRIEDKTAPPPTDDETIRSRQAMRQLIVVAIKAERAEIQRLVRARQLSDGAASRLIDNLDLLEARFIV